MNDESEIAKYDVKLMNKSLLRNLQQMKLKLEHYYTTVLTSNLSLFDRTKFIKVNFYY